MNRRIAVTCIVALSCLVILGAGGTMKTTYTFSIPDYRATPEEEIDAITMEALETYDDAVGDLIGQLQHPPELSNKAKVLIIYALGELRAYRATDVLIENINLVAETTAPKLALPRWSRYPAREALVKIGRYASGRIIDIVGSHKFEKEKVDGYAGVLLEIEKAEYALMKLRDRLERSEDDTARKQYERVIERVRELAEKHAD